MTASSKPHTHKHDLSALDTLTGGAFTAATASERATRLNDWLDSHPDHAHLLAVFAEMSHRDKGAAKLVREKLDEARKAKDQDALIKEWATTGEALRDAERINLADAMAWQRDAARAGAPLSREPLSQLKAALAERVRVIEDLQHRVQVQREAAVLLAQRIEVLSTKALADAQAALPVLQADVAQWQGLVDPLAHRAAVVGGVLAGTIDGNRADARLVARRYGFCGEVPRTVEQLAQEDRTTVALMTKRLRDAEAAIRRA